MLSGRGNSEKWDTHVDPKRRNLDGFQFLHSTFHGIYKIFHFHLPPIFQGSMQRWPKYCQTKPSSNHDPSRRQKLRGESTRESSTSVACVRGELNPVTTPLIWVLEINTELIISLLAITSFEWRYLITSLTPASPTTRSCSSCPSSWSPKLLTSSWIFPAIWTHQINSWGKDIYISTTHSRHC